MFTNGTRVEVPTIEGPRNTITLATVLGEDIDNPGHTLVHTDNPVMGMHIHSIENDDLIVFPRF